MSAARTSFPYNAPLLWQTLAATTFQVTIFIYGAVRFTSFMNFVKSANASGEYELVKTVLIILLNLYAPITVVSTTFAWVSYSEDWAAGYVFLFLPFVDIVLFLTYLMVTKNDISNQVDVARKARQRLPVQAKPAPFIRTVNTGGMSPARDGEPMTPQLRRSPSGAPALPMQTTPASPQYNEV